MLESKNSVQINVKDVSFHPLLKDIEDMFWIFLLSLRTLSDIEIQKTLRLKNELMDGYLSFNEMLDKFNATTNLKVEQKGKIATTTMNVLGQMIFMGKAMTIFAYELLRFSDYFERIKGNEEFKFLKLIRNGGAHNNKFNLKYQFGKKAGMWVIGENEVIKWNGLEISRKLQDTNVFNDFISVSTVFLLIKHFSEKLYEIDNLEKQSLC